jgi:hypothetical protein
MSQQHDLTGHHYEEYLAGLSAQIGDEQVAAEDAGQEQKGKGAQGYE